jgi:hypothetical protein
MSTVLLQVIDRKGEPIGQHYCLTHSDFQCEGNNCTIHKPSNHKLSQAPIVWREDTMLLNRRCLHGMLHPDRDDMNLHIKNGEDLQRFQHKCDGCC